MRIKLSNPMTEEDFQRMRSISHREHMEQDKEGNVYICTNDGVDEAYLQQYLNDRLADWIQTTSGKNILEGNESFQKQIKRYCDAKP